MTPKSKTAYLCGTAWGWELGETDVKLHESIKACKRWHSCTADCGIVEVKVTKMRWAKKPKPLARLREVVTRVKNDKIKVVKGPQFKP